MLKEILLVLVAFIWAVTIQANEAFLIGDETIADISGLTTALLQN